MVTFVGRSIQQVSRWACCARAGGGAPVAPRRRRRRPPQCRPTRPIHSPLLLTHFHEILYFANTPLVTTILPSWISFQSSVGRYIIALFIGFTYIKLLRNHCLLTRNFRYFCEYAVYPTESICYRTVSLKLLRFTASVSDIGIPVPFLKCLIVRNLGMPDIFLT